MPKVYPLMEIDAQQLDTLRSQLRVKFVDQKPRQMFQVEGFAPIYYPDSPADHSDNLPGGGCAACMRRIHANPDRPNEALVVALFIWLRSRWPLLSMIDAGALWGNTSLTAASIFDGSNIHLFEMNPFVSEALQGNVDFNRHLKAEFHVQNMVLSKVDRKELVSFRHFTVRYGASEGGINLSPAKIFRENLKSKMKKLVRLPTRGEYVKRQMKIATIDTYCREQNFVPNLIKVDVEGSEYDVLLGARNILSDHHPVLVVEFHPPDSANHIRKSNREMTQFLEKLEYRCLWGNHRDRNAPLYSIDGRTDFDLEADSLGIFY
jgi:FkbM family methyltransferase